MQQNRNRPTAPMRIRYAPHPPLTRSPFSPGRRLWIVRLSNCSTNRNLQILPLLHIDYIILSCCEQAVNRKRNLQNIHIFHITSTQPNHAPLKITNNPLSNLLTTNNSTKISVSPNNPLNKKRNFQPQNHHSNQSH